MKRIRKLFATTLLSVLACILLTPTFANAEATKDSEVIVHSTDLSKNPTYTYTKSDSTKSTVSSMSDVITMLQIDRN